MECADCFCSMVSKPDAKRRLLAAFCALWALPPAYADHYENLHKPGIQEGGGEVHVGRVSLPVLGTEAVTAAVVNRKERFARTGERCACVVSAATFVTHARLCDAVLLISVLRVLLVPDAMHNIAT